MKKLFVLSSLMVLIIILSVGIVDSLLTLSDDINNHLWLNLFGRWQSSESAYYEIEFSPDGTFSEYYYGVEKKFGDYQVHGSSIRLNYDLSSCRRDDRNSCTIYMKLYFEFRTIKLINNENMIIFNKVSRNKGQGY
jgi:hemolysin activation/secretion protein